MTKKAMLIIGIIISNLWICSAADVEYSNLAILKDTKATIKTAEKSYETEAIKNGDLDPMGSETIITVPFSIEFSFTETESINRVRIYPGNPMNAGNPSGDCGLSDYCIEAFIDGKWQKVADCVENARNFIEMDARGLNDYFYDHRFQPVQTDKIRLKVTKSGDTGLRFGTNEPVSQEARVTVIREIEVFSSEKLLDQGSISIRNKVQAEFTLPAYLNNKEAVLLVRPTGLNYPTTLTASIYERYSKRIPVEPIKIDITPGKDSYTSIDISSWPDGDYVVSIREFDGLVRGDSELIRAIRKQTILSPPPPQEPINVSGISTLFIDDYYIADKIGVELTPYQSEQRPVVVGALEEKYGNLNGLSIWKDGEKVHILIRAQTPDGSETKNFTATSTDYVNWAIEPQEPVIKSVAAEGKPQSSVPEPEKDISKPKYRFYDKDVDGEPVLREIRMKYTGYADTFWGDIRVAGRSWYSVWEKPNGANVILVDEPVIKDTINFAEGELGEWIDSNDNFGGQWLSKDGKTRFFSQARMIPRNEPFRVAYDNLYSGNRIMVVWRTQDGIDWIPTFLGLPNESDPLGYQHYGLATFLAEGGNLRIGHLLVYEALTQLTYRKLVYTRDGIYWNEMPGEAFLPNGEFGSWNFGNIGTNLARIVDDGTVYMVAHRNYNTVHFSYDMVDKKTYAALPTNVIKSKYEHRGMENWPYWKNVGSWEGLRDHIDDYAQSVGLIIYRDNGYAGLKTNDVEGVIITKVLTLNRQSGLGINARTFDGGSIKVEVLNNLGEALSDYCGDNAAVFKGDDTDSKLVWADGSINNLDGEFRLKITLDNAEIFALNW